MKLFNTSSQTKETFQPLHKDKVTMYVCGITPYDTTHLGHAFTYMAFDVLQRYLAFKGYHVTYTQNVTDVDDDLLRKAKEVGKDWQELGEFWTDKFVHDMKVLNITTPDHYVKATENIPTIISIVEKLIQQNVAYEKEGTVFFRTKRDPEYGKLSHYPREQMIKLSKERGANPDDPRKEDPLDFILWQKSLPDEPSWQSPWGQGRPGWHIECSAMSYQTLGEQIDIHGGGTDLIYPHHESEIAQSENFTGKKPFVKYWMHTGAVMYEGEKMSKSLGNLVMVSDLMKKYSANAIRYLLLSHHYREPWEFHEKELEEAQKQMDSIQENLKDVSSAKEDKELIDQITKLLDDDLATPDALKVLFSEVTNPEKQATIKYLLETVGFTFQ